MRKFRPVGYLTSPRGFRRAGSGFRNHSSDAKRTDPALFICSSKYTFSNMGFLASTPSRRVKKKKECHGTRMGFGRCFSGLCAGKRCDPRDMSKSARGLRVIWKLPGKLAGGVSGTTPLLRGHGMHGRKPSKQAETSRISHCEKADHGEAGVEYSSDGWGSVG
jgi:hypothetical protein